MNGKSFITYNNGTVREWCYLTERQIFGIFEKNNDIMEISTESKGKNVNYVRIYQKSENGAIIKSKFVVDKSI